MIERWLEDIEALAKKVEALRMSHPDYVLTHQSLVAAAHWLSRRVNLPREVA